MLSRYDEFELTDSAYRHGYDDEDVAEMLRGALVVIRNRHGRLLGYEVFGRNRGGAYLVAAGRVVTSSQGTTVFRVFHVYRMTDTKRRRFRSQGQR